LPLLSHRSKVTSESQFSELRAQLYALFSTYGKIIDVVAQKGAKKRGQAFVVFRDLAGATSALRSLDGELFYDKKMVRPSPLLDPLFSFSSHL
jgi:RNA recognition motif